MGTNEIRKERIDHAKAGKRESELEFSDYRQRGISE
jgi:hypothetical protein